MAIKLHVPLLARAASHNGAGTMSTWKVLGDEKAYSRYLTVFDRKVQFTAPATGEVGHQLPRVVCAQDSPTVRRVCIYHICLYSLICTPFHWVMALYRY